MRKSVTLFLLFINTFLLAQSGNPLPGEKYVLVIHGGAGTILKSQMTPDKEKAYYASLQAALDKGNAILKEGGNALDAVEAVVRTLEDDSLFNAGRGAVFTHEGRNELDAAIMDGRTLAAGSVAGVTTVKNPITLARAVMEKSPHVLLTGAGAEAFAVTQGIERVAPAYFRTESRWRALQTALEKDAQADSVIRYLEKLGKEIKQDTAGKRQQSPVPQPVAGHPELFRTDLGVAGKYGTVGAVALDRYGNLAAATSTGGMTNKRYGRVGDAPLIGAGTYANNRTVAISCTGWGEYFIRLVMAKSISDMMEFGKMTLREAAEEMVMKRLPALGGDGGLIAVDRDGNIALPFCTPGMYRGFVNYKGEREVRIYRE